MDEHGSSFSPEVDLRSDLDEALGQVIRPPAIHPLDLPVSIATEIDYEASPRSEVAKDLYGVSVASGMCTDGFPNKAPQQDAAGWKRRLDSKRNRVSSVPPARTNPSTMTSMERSLMTHDPNEGAKTFAPRIGLTFDSCTEAYEHYNLYSWENGFGIRHGKSRWSESGYQQMHEIVCQCQGKPDKENSVSCKTGCKSKMRLLCTEDHGWYVSIFCDEHNHPLTESRDETRQWIRIKTVKLLDEMKTLDPNLSVCIDFDDSGSPKSVLWCTGKNKQDYVYFGDVVTFDTTYRTNLYNMPFGIFVGVNNHYQSTIFGGVLLRHETISAFEWAFGKFVEVMNGKHRVTILTDQCKSMEGAIKTTLPNSRNRWCKWHVLKCAKENLGVRNVVRVQIISSNSTFPRSAPMHLFVKQYNNLLKSKKNDEGKEQHITNMKRRKYNGGHPLEVDAGEIYTSAVYAKFEEEFYRSMSLEVSKCISETEYEIKRGRPDYTPEYDSRSFVVTIRLICRHCIKVLVRNDIFRILPKNILKSGQGKQKKDMMIRR